MDIGQQLGGMKTKDSWELEFTERDDHQRPREQNQQMVAQLSDLNVNGKGESWRLEGLKTLKYGDSTESKDERMNAAILKNGVDFQ